MSKETPKPWVAVPRHGNHDKDEMSGLGWDIEGPPEPMLRGQFALAADAHKAAAAPELFDALQEFVTAGCRAWCDYGDHTTYCVAGYAAIAKAKGEAA